MIQDHGVDFFVIDEAQAAAFVKHFFPDENVDFLKNTNKLNPKTLLVAPHKRLNWQYHHRRAEIWKCIGGVSGIVTSDTDEEKTQHQLVINDINNGKFKDKKSV